MKRIAIIPVIFLSACNYMHLKPDTMEKGTVVYAERGGYSIRRALKENLEERGYDVRVGKIRNTGSIETSGDFASVRNVEIPDNTRYVIIANERAEKFFPIWCVFNGYWWWRFNVSIADQRTGEELLTWSGRGCANSTLRRLDRALDELEK